MLIKPRIKPGPADISDLRSNQVVQWQYRWYYPLAFIFGIFVPTFIPGYFWGDWMGGFYYAAIIRMVATQQVNIFCFTLSMLFTEYISLHFKVDLLRKLSSTLDWRGAVRR
jgi:fatty-acid desaturase